ncbi:MAG: methyltransferase family protein [Promethearchaeota archaeon]
MREIESKIDEEMSSWGVGPKMLITLFPIIVFFATLHFIFYPTFLFPINPIWMIIIGLILIIIGIPIYILSKRAIKKANFPSKLMTKGIYGHMRHPLYASFILFIVPGIVCLFNSWILFFIPISCYLIFKLYIKEEEEYCLERFGEKYKDYKKKVYAIFPKMKKYKEIQLKNN